jgi:aminopeptidase N
MGGTRRPRRRALRAAILATAFAAVFAPAAHADGPVFSPGAHTAGDPYFPTLGNGGYRTTHYDLVLRYHPTSGRLGGTATIAARAAQNLSSFSLDLAGLTASTVRVDGAPARFRQAKAKLVVTPPHGLPAGSDFLVTVGYAGRPTSTRGQFASSPVGWLHTASGGASALSEPNGAGYWFPCDDTPADKATYDITVTAPSTMSVLANGVLATRRASGDQTTWHWHEAHPMATYLATVSIGRFRVSRAKTSDGIRLYSAIDDHLPAAIQGQARTTMWLLPGLLTRFARQFGPYPFDAAGGIVTNVGGDYALETQSKPSYERFTSPEIQAHEISHQWFGDSVSIARWSDVWLNEGLATFAQWLWDEWTSGISMTRQLAIAYTDRDGWDHPPAAPGPADLFGVSVYDHAGAGLAALRLVIGDHRMFRLLRTWTADHRYGNATTADFLALLRAQDGAGPERFLHHWLYTRHKPVLPRAVAARLPKHPFSLDFFDEFDTRR